ncbi:hypothetical protein A0J48_009105 [Sphaerospermopsis aphanizomenoides BCCUSP55]|uniref:hypothetical protein n=1 Tax=Sphaerospermopsis aphanizomenoides TaxID=459663 RepID=UPI001904A1E9|nr:hypothetical protein [Sphaerospermopsis aphanizomenoides]MBK1987691.1 hypothetical protein [Sphaerospermopsis aphanizomenoides BCCUSP55]
MPINRVKPISACCPSSAKMQKAQSPIISLVVLSAIAVKVDITKLAKSSGSLA